MAATKTITQLLAEFPTGGPVGGITPAQAQDLIVTLGAMAGTYDLADYTSAGTTLAGATQITTYNARITSVPSGTGVKLQNVVGVVQNILNRGVNAVNVYPPSTSITLESLTPAGTPYQLGVGANMSIIVLDASTAIIQNVNTVAGGVPSIPIPYGMPIAAIALGNTTCGPNNPLTYRFQCPTTANLQSCRVFFQGGTGYSAGTGGTIRCNICPDDGTSNHSPVTGSPLSNNVDCIVNGTAGHSLGTSINGFNYELLTWSPAVPMVAGTIYHLVFTNVDAAPSTNYFSPDMLSAEVGSPLETLAGPFSPYWMHSYFSGSWVDRPYQPPIAQYTFSDGTVYGIGWTEADYKVSPPDFAILNPNQVRQVFAPTVNRTFTTLRFSCSGYDGANRPIVRIEDASAVAIPSGTGTMTVDPVFGNLGGASTAPYWFIFTFPAFTFLSGTTYRLVFTQTAGTLKTAGMRKGSTIANSPSGPFDSKVCFPDGWMEFSTNTGGAWSQTLAGVNGAGARQDDLQFMLT